MENQEDQIKGQFEDLLINIESIKQNFKDQIIKGQFKVTDTDGSFTNVTTFSGHDFRVFNGMFEPSSAFGFIEFYFDEDETAFVRDLFEARCEDFKQQKILNDIKTKEEELVKLKEQLS